MLRHEILFKNKGRVLWTCSIELTKAILFVPDLTQNISVGMITFNLDLL